MTTGILARAAICNTLGAVACPANLLGEASVYLVPHHGNFDSNVPAVIAALRPRAAIMNNGATKGGAPDAFETHVAALYSEALDGAIQGERNAALEAEGAAWSESAAAAEVARIVVAAILE